MDRATKVALETIIVQVEQAVFTSTRSKKSQGYHVVAVSPGVDDGLKRQLSLWGPSHAALLSDAADAESFNFHPLVDDWVAVSRTVHGGPEYSRRGGLEVFTHFLLLRSDQLSAYHNDPLQLALTAQALGHLRFRMSVNDRLPHVDLPDHSLAGIPRVQSAANVPVPEILRVLKSQNRIAVLGLKDPLPVLSLILQEMPLSERLTASFSTGLRPSLDRSFRIHFADHSDSSLHALLSSQGIDYVTAS